MPHNPVAARQQFYAQTSNLKSGFGASVAEISWSTGEILNYETVAKGRHYDFRFLYYEFSVEFSSFLTSFQSFKSQ
jgi:hypothetical protein